MKKLFSLKLLCVLVLLAAFMTNCAGGSGGCINKKLSYKITPTPNTTRMGVTKDGLTIVFKHLKELIINSLESKENADGFIEIPVDSILIEDKFTTLGQEAKYKVTLEDPVFLLKWEDVKVDISKQFTGNQVNTGARVMMSIENAKIALSQDMHLKGDISINACTLFPFLKPLLKDCDLSLIDVACPISNGLSVREGGKEEFIAGYLSATANILVNIDRTIDPNTGLPKGTFKVRPIISSLDIKDLKFKVESSGEKVCQNKACDDNEWVLNLAGKDECWECEQLCPYLSKGSDLVVQVGKYLKGANKYLLGAALSGAIRNAFSGLNGKSLVLQDEGNINEMARKDNRLPFKGSKMGFLYTPNEIEVNCGTRFCIAPDILKTLELTFDGGMDSRPVTRCAPIPKEYIADPEQYVKNTFKTTAPPDLTGVDPQGNPYHAAASFARAFFERGLFSLYIGGNLCVSIYSEDIEQASDIKINSQAITLLIPELKELLPDNARILMRMNPSKMPSFRMTQTVKTVGNYQVYVPTMQISFEKMGLSLYAYIFDRYTRLFHFEFDLNIEAQMSILPNREMEFNVHVVDVKNIKQTYHEFVKNLDATNLIKNTVDMTLGMFLKDSLTFPVEVEKSLQNYLGVPVSVKISNLGLEGKGQVKDYVTLYLNFEECQGGKCQNMIMAAAETKARLEKEVEMVYDKNGYLVPDGKIVIHTESQEENQEYQYRVDGLYWSSFQQGGQIEVESSMLKLPGRHLVEVRSRYAGHYNSLDQTPVRITVIVDPFAPSLEVFPVPEGIRLLGKDNLFNQSELTYSYNLFDADGIKVQSSDFNSQDLISQAQLKEVDWLEARVMDPKGNISGVVTYKLAAQNQLPVAIEEIDPASKVQEPEINSVYVDANNLQNFNLTGQGDNRASSSGGCHHLQLSDKIPYSSIIFLGLALLIPILIPLFSRIRARSCLFATLFLAMTLSGCDCDETPLKTYTQFGECPSNKILIRGECENKFCDPEDPLSCCPGRFCSSEGKCVLETYTCENDSQCPSKGQTCQEFEERNMCLYKSCASADQCQRGQFCFSHSCISDIPCNGKCPNSNVCVAATNKCYPVQGYGCDRECGSGEILVLADPENMTGPTCGSLVCRCEKTKTQQEGRVGPHSAMAIGKNAIYVSAYDDHFGDLALLFFDRNGHRFKTIYIDGLPLQGETGNGADVGKYSSIAVDQAENVHISYYDATNRGLKYARILANGQKNVQKVDLPRDRMKGNLGIYTKIKLDSFGNPFIAYYVDRDRDTMGKTVSGLRLANMGPGGQWLIRTVEEKTKPLSSLPACDNTCLPSEICAEDSTGRGICLTSAKGQCIGTDGKSRCKYPHTCVLEANMPVCKNKLVRDIYTAYPRGLGMFPSLVMKNDIPYLSYYDGVSGDLKVAYFSEGSFITMIVDGSVAELDDEGKIKKDSDDKTIYKNTTNVGFFSSLAFNTRGEPAISYYDLEREELVVISAPTFNDLLQEKFAASRKVVDSGIITGRYPVSLVGSDAKLLFDTRDRAYIIYQDSTHNDLKMALQKSAGKWDSWLIKSLRSEGAHGFYADMEMEMEKIYIKNLEVSKRIKGSVNYNLEIFNELIP